MATKDTTKKEPVTFIPQYFEIREVGKRIKSTKKQYIWRFNLASKDFTIELFNSTLSGKKKVVLNGQIKAEIKQKNAFVYQLQVEGKRMMIQDVNASFDLIYDGKFFQEMWEAQKRKNTFDWNNRNTKHDAFQVHEFGDSVAAGLKPTSREQNKELAKKLQMDLMEEKKQDKSADGKGVKKAAAKGSRSAAAAENVSKQEQDQIEEAIRLSMKEMELKEKDKDPQPTEGAKKPKPEKSAEDGGFGLDSAFADYSTYNGKTVGTDGGPKVSTSETSGAAAAQDSTQQPQEASHEFNFDFAGTGSGTAQSRQSAAAPSSSVGIDDLLDTTGPVTKTQSFIQKQADIFQFDNIQNNNNNNNQDQFFVNGISQQQPQQNSSSDPFGLDSVSVPNMQQDQNAQAQQQQKAKFIPDASSFQTAQQQQQNMMTNMMAQAMQNQYQTNMMMQQQMMAAAAQQNQGFNPFMQQQQQQQQPNMAGGVNPFMTNQMQGGGQNPFASMNGQNNNNMGGMGGMGGAPF